MACDDLTRELEGPGVGIRRTAEYFEITRSGDYDSLMAHCKRVMSS